MLFVEWVGIFATTKTKKKGIIILRLNEFHRGEKAIQSIHSNGDAIEATKITEWFICTRHYQWCCYGIYAAAE